jgi:hypothetical protein
MIHFVPIVDVVVPLQSLCSVPGASQLMSFAVTLLSGGIAFAGILKIGGNSISGMFSSGRGSADLRRAIVAGIGGLAVGLFFPDLIGFVAENVLGSGLDEAGIGCITG